MAVGLQASNRTFGRPGVRILDRRPGDAEPAPPSLPFLPTGRGAMGWGQNETACPAWGGYGFCVLAGGGYEGDEELFKVCLLF